MVEGGTNRGDEKASGDAGGRARGRVGDARAILPVQADRFGNRQGGIAVRFDVAPALAHVRRRGDEGVAQFGKARPGPRAQ